jgi:1-phosphatidylinositol-4-phosphate 5-kinase
MPPGEIVQDGGEPSLGARRTSSDKMIHRLSSEVVSRRSSQDVKSNGLTPAANGGLAVPRADGFGLRNKSSLDGGEEGQARLSGDKKPTRLATRDDGLFAETAESTRESFFPSFVSSTHVSLSAVNGNGPTPPIDGVPESKSQENWYPLEEQKTAELDSNLVLNEKEQNSSTRREPSPGHKVAQIHRISSPPALQASSPAPSNPVIVAPQPGKLQHRHTLEVPRLSTSRASKDSMRTSDENAITTGRFSPAPNTPTHRRASVSLIRKVTRTGGHSDLHLDDAPPSEDADRWAEIIRQRRASKRRKRDDDDDDRVVMGTKVDQNHVNYVIAYNMLTGIRFTVSRTNAKVDRELTDADFDAKHKFSFDITGNELTPSAKYDFKFKDYAPWVFRHLRSIFRLDPADYLMSLTSKYILSELGSPGKSGSFFYFSRDYKYIIKTIHHAEHKVLRKILRQYYQHVRQNPNTLLSQFYGLHRVKIPYGRKIHFVVMNNLFPPHRDIHKTFDLKGSTVGRDFKEEDLEKNPRATLKDLNWLRRNMHLELGPTKKHAFIEQMQRDVALLESLKIMDYSLLVGIHDLSRGNEDKLRDKTLQVFQPGGPDKPDEQSVPIAPVATTNALMRTPSKLENQRKAKELRETLMNEKPVPMGLTASRMPEEMSEGHQRKDFYFYSDDGGFRATHEDNSPGEQIYYLGIIDCLTHVSFLFTHPLQQNLTQSAVRPDKTHRALLEKLRPPGNPNLRRAP